VMKVLVNAVVLFEQLLQGIDILEIDIGRIDRTERLILRNIT